MEINKITQQQAIAYLTEIIQHNQDLRSRQTGFGFGFVRWVTSRNFRSYVFSKYLIELSYKDIRKLLTPLVSKKLIDVKRSKSSLTQYSTMGWEGCTAINDYFIEGTHE